MALDDLTVGQVNVNESKISGAIAHTKLGRINFIIIGVAVNCPPIHSIVVVTSPMWIHAPPALAAKTTIPIKNIMICLSLINFLSNETITIVVVRLSSTEERKNVRMEIVQSSLRTSVVFIFSVITSNPSCASMSSTIVMAPKKKNNIPDISPKYSGSCSETRCTSAPPII